MAAYTIAHESGIDVSKYLGVAETAEVRGLLSQLKVTQSVTRVPVTAKALRRKPVHVTIAGMKVERLPGLSAAHAAEAKQMAERVYPALYVFENSLRDIIERLLRSKVGVDWWKTAVPGDVQQHAAQHMADEKKDPWHGKRGSRELDYILLTDLLKIVRAQWRHLGSLFPSQSWLESLVGELNVSRRVIAHMNPLTDDDIQGIEVAFKKWMKQIQSVEDALS